MDRLPALVSLLALLVPFVITFLGVVCWVTLDADARGSRWPAFWGVGSALSGVLGLWYLDVARRELGPRSSPPGRGDRLALVAALGGIASMVLSTVVSPPDPFTQPLYFFGFFVVAAPVVYVLAPRFGFGEPNAST